MGTIGLASGVILVYILTGLNPWKAFGGNRSEGNPQEQ